MMNKEQVLAVLQSMVATGQISQDEILASISNGRSQSGITTIASNEQRMTVSQVLYAIGGAIIFLGVAILLWQNWNELSPSIRILSTLGVGLAAYIAGILLSRDERTGALPSAFFIIAGLTTPLGLYVTLDYFGFSISDYNTQMLIAFLLTLQYVTSFILFKKNIFLVFSIIFSTWLVYSLVGYISHDNSILYEWNLYQYLTMVIGLAYILLGYAFDGTRREGLTGSLYGFGLIGLLGAPLVIGGFWDTLAAFLILITLVLSVYLRSKAFLTFGSIFLVIYILKITGKYFTKSMGWSLTLVLAGLVLIAVGYFAFYLNKKYISSHAEI
jgi:hypothetical protein